MSRRTRRKSNRKLSNNCSRPRGFTMIAHCKAIGKLKRKYIKSPKYRSHALVNKVLDRTPLFLYSLFREVFYNKLEEVPILFLFVLYKYKR